MDHDALPPRLSVVIATVDCATTIRSSLNAIIASCRSFRTQVIVVDASTDGTRDLLASEFPQVRLLTATEGTLVPYLWAQGIRVCTGDIVAFSTGHCAPVAGWATALLNGFEDGVAGVGGAFDLKPGAGATDGAVFLLRYSAFMGAVRAPEASSDIAADNAAYRRELLEEYADTWDGGFWEVEFHRELDSPDRTLRFVPDALVIFDPDATLGAYVKQRFEHGRHFGRWRAGRNGESVWRIVSLAPLVPAVLLLRIWRRARAAGRIRTFLFALPQLATLTAAWAAGELVGALGKTSRSVLHSQE
jgi:hypothetical protein